MSMSRSSHARAILGADLHPRIENTNVLLVGAGGIGCELLKNLTLTGFGHITLLDLDTIDLSNLNRQFLFRKKDVKQSKAFIATRTAQQFNPNIKITPLHANIKDPQFDIQWFKSFDIVLNALDNLDARRHVNKMCIAANIPLVESGTAGYLGQVQPLVKDRTECFDCISKPTPKTFPVCTIRSTPSTPIHCIVWAKSYLCGQLFGEDEDASGELDEAEKQGEDAQEIATLRREAQAFQTVRSALRSPQTKEGEAARMAFHKIFNTDILNLLSMSDMWKSRTPPTPLDFDSIINGSFVESASSSTAIGAMDGASTKGVNASTSSIAAINASTNGANASILNGVPSSKSSSLPPSTSTRSQPSRKAKQKTQAAATVIKSKSVSGAAAKTRKAKGAKDGANKGEEMAKMSNGAVMGQKAGLKDQRRLSLKDNLELFVSSTNRMAARLRTGEETITFDKDDDDTLDFVTAAANLRSFAYGIEVKTRWDVKEMAGNIIPAIATTNAVVSGLIVLQALQLLRKSYSTLKNVHLQFKPAVPLSTINLCPPNPNCGICRDTYTSILCDPSRVTLGDVVNGVLGSGQGEGDGTGKRDVGVYEDKRILSDPDWEDNWQRTLESLNVTRGKFLTIVDEEGEWGTIAVGLGVLPPHHPADAPPFILPSPLPQPPRTEKPPAPSTPLNTISLKRAAPDDEDVLELEPSSKRAKTNGGGILSSPSKDSISSPSKKRRLEEDGLIMMESKDDNLDDDIIEIDD